MLEAANRSQANSGTHGIGGYFWRFGAMALALAMPVSTLAQAMDCRPPANLPRPQAEGPTQREPARRMATGGYKLTLIWTPAHCRERGRAAEGWPCARAGRFALHGLWPDGLGGKSWPQYCAPAPLLKAETLRRNICATPSVQLLQHEWAKHGTCMSRDPDRYFAEARRLYDGLRYPDMAALARGPALTQGGLARAFARANRINARAVQVRTNRAGWLEEIWLCLDKTRHYAACPGRLANSIARVKIAIGGPRR